MEERVIVEGDKLTFEEARIKLGFSIEETTLKPIHKGMKRRTIRNIDKLNKPIMKNIEYILIHIEDNA